MYSAGSLVVPHHSKNAISRLKNEFIRPYYYFAKITVLCVIFVLQRTSKWGKWFSAVCFMFHCPTSPFELTIYSNLVGIILTTIFTLGCFSRISWHYNGNERRYIYRDFLNGDLGCQSPMLIKLLHVFWSNERRRRR